MLKTWFLPAFLSLAFFFSQPHLSRGGLYNPVPCSFSLQFTSCLQSIGVSLLQLWGKWLHASTEKLRKLKPRLAKRLARVTHGKSAPSGSRTSRPAFSCRAPASGPIHTVCGGLVDGSHPAGLRWFVWCLHISCYKYCCPHT